MLGGILPPIDIRDIEKNDKHFMDLPSSGRLARKDLFATTDINFNNVLEVVATTRPNLLTSEFQTSSHIDDNAHY